MKPICHGIHLPTSGHDTYRFSPAYVAFCAMPTSPPSFVTVGLVTAFSEILYTRLTKIYSRILPSPQTFGLSSTLSGSLLSCPSVRVPLPSEDVLSMS